MTKRDIEKKVRADKGLLERHDVRALFLFGSCARGTDNEKSDVDVLVEFVKPTYRKLIGLGSDLEALFRRKVDLVTVGGLDPYIRKIVLDEAVEIARR